jgi:hypothetical protein
MKAITIAGSLNWSGWLRGVIGAFVSGGAAGIGAATAVTAFDPSHDIVGWTLSKVVGLTFVITGIVSLAKFLQSHPLPDRYEDGSGAFKPTNGGTK